MAAAWSLSRGSNNRDSVSRLVSTLSLDGYRVAVELVVRFNRALNKETAESIGNEVARIADEILGAQISQGSLPLTKDELTEKVLQKVTASANKISELQINALHVGGSGMSQRSNLRARTPTAPKTPSTLRSGNSSKAEVATPVPSVRVPPNGSPSDVARTPSNGARSPSPPPQPPQPLDSLWPRALSACPVGVGTDRISHLLAPALRDSTATGILYMLSAIKPTLVDRLSLLEGQHPLPQLRRETCACIAAALYRAMVSSGVDRKRAISLVEEAVRHALAPDAPPAQEVGQYLGSGSPVRDLCARLAAVFGAPDEAKTIYGAVTQYYGGLGVELQKVARDIMRLTA